MAVRETTIDAERAVLGAVLRQDRLLEPLLTELGLRAHHFYDLNLGAVFAAMSDLHDAGGTVDRLTVAAALTNSGAAHEASVRGVLDILDGPVPNLAGWRDHALLIVDDHRWRTREQQALAAVAAAQQRDEDAYNAATAIAEQTTGRGDEHSRTPEQLADEFIDWFDGTDTPAIPLPFQRLTNLLRGGLRAGDTTVLAGWSSMGKSVFADQILEHARINGCTAWLYVNEMSVIDRTCRLLASRSGIPFERIVAKTLSDNERAMVLQEVPRLPFGVTVCAGWSARDIARDVRSRKVDIAVIDTVTRIPASTTSEWDAVSGTLADAARQSGTHLVLVSQLNRERAKDPARPAPVLRDLRNTGAWETDARNVLFVHRHEKTVPETGAAEMDDNGFVHIAKASNGGKGACAVRLDTRAMRFREIDMSRHLEAA